MSLLMLAMLFMGLAAMAGVYRLAIGPTLTDRIIGLDMLFACAIGFCLLAAWTIERTVYLDVAIGLALTSIVVTLSWARLIELQSQAEQP